MENNYPKVGVGVMIWKGGKVLLGKRKGSHGANQYSFPGGHLEYLESFEDCALREIAEECGVEVTNLKFQFLANRTTFAPKHYVHIGFTADWAVGEPQVLEPEKCEGWGWYYPEQLPEPLFEFCKLAFDAHREQKVYY